MKFNLASIVRRTLLLEACMLPYSHIVFAQFAPVSRFSNSSISSTPIASISTPADNQTAATTCGSPSCYIRIDPQTLRYTQSVDVRYLEQTAFVVPIIYTYADGRKSSTNITVQDGPTGSAFTPMEQATLTWETYGTILTFPTSYVAYPFPDLIRSTLAPLTNGEVGPQTCTELFSDILLPHEQTARFIFPITAKDESPTPSAQLLFDYLDALPTVTELLGGGNPRNCLHTTPPHAVDSSVLYPFEPQIYTTVSVLTQIGNPVTLAANPFGDPPPPSPTSGLPQLQDPEPNPGGGGGGSPSIGASATGGGSSNNPAPPPVIIDGNTITPIGNGGVIINSQTIAPGGTGTLANGAPISVPSDGGAIVVGNVLTNPAVVVVGGSSATVTLPGAAAPSAITVDGTVITPVANAGGVIINGQTFEPGATGTLANGAPFSVPTSGSIIIVGSLSTGAGVVVTGTASSTVTISRISSSASSTSSRPATSSGAAAEMYNAFESNRYGVVAFEGTLVAAILGLVGLL